jgi:hypothetical protein
MIIACSEGFLSSALRQWCWRQIHQTALDTWVHLRPAVLDVVSACWAGPKCLWLVVLLLLLLCCACRLDFKGCYITNTDWNWQGNAVIDNPAFTTDADPTTFNR